MGLTMQKVKVLITQSCLTLCNPIDCSTPGSSVHGTLQAQIPEWVAIPFSRGSSWPRDQTQVSCIGRQSLYHLSHQRSPNHADAKPAFSTIYEVTLKADLFLVLVLWDPVASAGWVASLSLSSPQRTQLSGLCKVSGPVPAFRELTVFMQSSGQGRAEI